MNEVTFTRPTAQTLQIAATGRGSDEARTTRGAVPIVEQYWRVALRWKWLIAAAVAAALVIGILMTLLATPQYTATTRLEISREGSQIVQMGQVEPETRGVDMEFYQTQYGLLQSKAMAERVVRVMRLTDDPKFFALFGREDVFERSGQSAAAARSARVEVATKLLLDQVEVAPIRLSRLVDLSWSSPDPDLSARVANAWTTEFIEFNLERRFEATAYARKFLEDRLAQLRGRLEDSERQLVGFASNQGIINIPSGPADENGVQPERSLTADSLVALNSQLAQATGDRLRAQSRLDNAGVSQESVSSSVIGGMREERAQAAAAYAKMTSQFEPGYPPAQAIASQIRELDNSIAREEARVQGSIRSAFSDAQQREQALIERVDALKGSFLDQRRRSIQYNIYQREVDTNRELYNGLLQRYKEIGVGGGVGNNNILIVDTAKVPDRPSHPRPLLNLLISLIAGLVAGIGLALLREQMDETVSDPAELERKLGLPLLGAIPDTGQSDPRVELRDPKSGLTEAYLSVQSSLAFSSDHGIPRTLAVTSTRAGEGKSTTAFAIAYSIARSGARTLLVDADMRSPSVHGNLGLSNSRGLSTYLAGNDDLASLIQHSEADGLSVMAAGPSPPNAAELLRGPRLAKLFSELRDRYDHVIVDSPPVLGLADAPNIASATEGTVYVLEAQSVKARLATRAIDRLRQARSNLVGTVLTKFNPKRAHLGYGYEYGYGYGQDKAYGESSAKAS